MDETSFWIDQYNFSIRWKYMTKNRYQMKDRMRKFLFTYQMAYQKYLLLQTRNLSQTWENLRDVLSMLQQREPMWEGKCVCSDLRTTELVHNVTHVCVYVYLSDLYWQWPCLVKGGSVLWIVYVTILLHYFIMSQILLTNFCTHVYCWISIENKFEQQCNCGDRMIQQWRHAKLNSILLLAFSWSGFLMVLQQMLLHLKELKKYIQLHATYIYVHMF